MLDFFLLFLSDPNNRELAIGLMVATFVILAAAFICSVRSMRYISVSLYLLAIACCVAALSLNLPAAWLVLAIGSIIVVVVVYAWMLYEISFFHRVLYRIEDVRRRRYT